MSEISEENKITGSFLGYEYHSITIPREIEPVYMNGYENFEWIRKETTASSVGSSTINMKFKQDRKIRSKTELTKPQRQFEVCVNEIVTIGKSKDVFAVITAFSIGLLDCAFFAGATFSYLVGMLGYFIIRKELKKCGES